MQKNKLPKSADSKSNNPTEVRGKSSEVACYQRCDVAPAIVVEAAIVLAQSGSRVAIVVGELHDRSRREVCWSLVRELLKTPFPASKCSVKLFPEGVVDDEAASEIAEKSGIPVGVMETFAVNAIDGHALDMKELAGYRLARQALAGRISFEEYYDSMHRSIDPLWTNEQITEAAKTSVKRFQDYFGDRLIEWGVAGILEATKRQWIFDIMGQGLFDDREEFPESLLQFSEYFLRRLREFDPHDVALVAPTRQALGVASVEGAAELWPLARSFTLEGWHDQLKREDPISQFQVNCCVMESTHWSREARMALAVRDNLATISVLQVGAYHADNYLPELLKRVGLVPVRLLMS